jgi:hypothetical protein
MCSDRNWTCGIVWCCLDEVFAAVRFVLHTLLWDPLFVFIAHVVILCFNVQIYIVDVKNSVVNVAGGAPTFRRN